MSDVLTLTLTLPLPQSSLWTTTDPVTIGCSFLRDSKPEPPSSAVPGDLTSETA